MFQIDLKSRDSIYEQVIENVKRLVFTGILKTDAKLPSVRELSRTLTMNPNTVQKAYRELERQGVIYTVAGRGCFVADSQGQEPDRERVTAMFEDMKRLIEELLFMGMDRDGIRNEVERILESCEEREEGGDPA